MKKLTSIVALALALTSCQQFEKTKSGLPYKITKGSGGAKLKSGQFIKFNVEFKVGANDSVLNSTFEHIPAFTMYDTARLGKYNFTEILPLMSVGDKAEFSLSIDTLKSLGMIPEFNKTFAKGGVVKGRIELLQAFNSEADVNAAYQKAMEAEKEKEIKALEAYIAQKGIKAQKTPGGAFVEIITPGDATAKADSGKQVTVLYKGYTVEGKVFDSNMGKENAAKPPMNVVIGAHSVIPGWEEGLKYFGKGGKGKILVPSMLAYGPQGAGADIKPYTNLVFDVEITDVTTPAPKLAQPSAPNAPQVMPQGH